MKSTKSLLMVTVAALLMVGCNTRPIYEPKNVRIEDQNVKISDATVGKKIKNAADAHGWRCHNTGANVMQCKIDRRGHIAVIEIPYSKDSYSINYVSSKNFKSDNHGEIHKKYNQWIKLLQDSIDAELAS